MRGLKGEMGQKFDGWPSCTVLFLFYFRSFSICSNSNIRISNLICRLFNNYIAQLKVPILEIYLYIFSLYFIPFPLFFFFSISIFKP
jgi:hypothetical protein